MLSNVITREPSELDLARCVPLVSLWVDLPLCVVPVIRSSMALLLSLLFWLFSNPATPATWGVAIEVPL